jgi:hypothetical protein
MTLTLKSGLTALGTPRLLFAAALGLIAWALPRPEMQIGLGYLAFSALIEETAFRFGLQHFLEKVLHNRLVFLGLSWANLGTSILFALLHLISHPPLWALAAFFPSLVFGWAWTRYQSLLPCWMLHFIYNVFYFYRP